MVVDYQGCVDRNSRGAFSSRRAMMHPCTPTRITHVAMLPRRQTQKGSTAHLLPTTFWRPAPLCQRMCKSSALSNAQPLVLIALFVDRPTDPVISDFLDPLTLLFDLPHRCSTPACDILRNLIVKSAHSACRPLFCPAAGPRAFFDRKHVRTVVDLRSRT